MMVSIPILILIALSAGLWVWALIDIMRVRFKSHSTRTAMLVITLFFPLLGPLLYLAIRKSLITKGRRTFDPDFSKNN